MASVAVRCNRRMRAARRRVGMRICGAGLCVVLVGGCTAWRDGISPRADDPTAPGDALAGADFAPVSAAAGPPDGARTVEEFDTTTAADRREAAVAAAGGAPLGRTIASLGNPGLPGFWAETPLVDETRPGRLTDPATGAGVGVELRPSGGAPGSGTLVSLPAFRVLGLPLTDLPELEVSGP